VCRGRIFWASKDGNSALIIPDHFRRWQRSYEKKSQLIRKKPEWMIWDRNQKQNAIDLYEKYILDTPPVLYHHIKVSNKIRVKCVDEHKSYYPYYYKNMQPPLHLGPRYAKYLPEQYYAQYIATCYFCRITDWENIQSRYGD
jgi:hypothetical protein